MMVNTIKAKDTLANEIPRKKSRHSSKPKFIELTKEGQKVLDVLVLVGRLIRIKNAVDLENKVGTASCETHKED